MSDVLTSLRKNLTRCKDAPQDYDQWMGWDLVEELPLIDCLEGVSEILDEDPPRDTTLIAARCLLSIAHKRLTELSNALTAEISA